MKNKNGFACSIPAGLAIGTLYAIIWTILMTMGISYAIICKWMPEDNIGYCAMLILFTASFIGAITSIKKIKHQKMMAAIATGIIFWGVLLGITGICFGGHYAAIPESASMILIGSLSATFLYRQEKKKNVIKKRHLKS